MNVRELIKILEEVEDKKVTIFAMVGDSCKAVTSVEVYEDAVELWAR